MFTSTRRIGIIHTVGFTPYFGVETLNETFNREPLECLQDEMDKDMWKLGMYAAKEYFEVYLVT